jgi:hypothetical protein
MPHVLQVLAIGPSENLRMLTIRIGRSRSSDKFLSDILIKLETKFNAVLETLLAIETWNDE